MNSLHTYIGVKSCGCIVAMVSDWGDKITAESVAEFIANGLVVERVPHAEAVARFGRCIHQARASKGLTLTQMELPR